MNEQINGKKTEKKQNNSINTGLKNTKIIKKICKSYIYISVY